MSLRGAIMFKPWKKKPISCSRQLANSLSEMLLTQVLPAQTFPVVGYIADPKRDNKVVFPEPEGPTKRVNSPVRNSIVVGFSATMVDSPVLYSFPASDNRAAISIILICNNK